MTEMKNQYSGNKGSGRVELEQMILDNASRLRVPSGRTAEEALTLLKARIARGEAVFSGEKDFQIVDWVSSIAAGLLLLLAIWQIGFNPSRDRIVAQKGSHEEYRLPDGSDVSLNADSRISFNNRNFNNNRHVSLDGEAFFNVIKGSDFIVSTPAGDVKVLGTSFNVYARENSFRVSCLTGKILVSAQDQSVIITPGESVKLADKKLISYTDTDLSLATRWIDGEFVFENMALNLVFDEIERQFNVNFACRNFNDKFFTGSFSNKDLRIALEIVCIPMGLKYEIGSNGEIFVTENPD
jgi:transmembrane sensor